eukprot:4975396-Amphidinium_carterae.1
MINEQRIAVRQLVHYFFNRDILDIPLCLGSVPMLPAIIPRHPCGQHNPALRRSPFFVNPFSGVLGPDAERLGKGKGKDRDEDKGKGKGEMHGGKGRDEEANPAPLPHPIGPPVMKAPAKPSTPSYPKMKPPPTKAPEVTVTDMVKAQPTQRPGTKPPPANVVRPGFKGPPAGIAMPPPWAPAANPVPSSSPAGVKANFKGPPEGHPDYEKEVPITYLPFTPKNPPPQLPVVPQNQMFKPPPAPGYGGLTPQQYEEAQEKYRRDLANRRAQANRDHDVDERRDYGSGSASQVLRRLEPSLETGQQRQRRVGGMMVTRSAEGVLPTRCPLLTVQRHPPTPRYPHQLESR